MRKTEFIAGSFGKKKEEGVGGIFSDKRLLDKAEKELNTDFLADLYDKAMETLFEEKYSHASDDEGKDLEKRKGIDMQLLNDKVENVGVDAGDEQEYISEDQEGGVDDRQFIKKQKAKKLKEYEGTLAKSLKK